MDELNATRARLQGALAALEEARRELETMTYVAQQNKRHVTEQTQYAEQVERERDVARRQAAGWHDEAQRQAEHRDVMFPVVAAARAIKAARGNTMALADAYDALAAAVDSYETKESTDG